MGDRDLVKSTAVAAGSEGMLAEDYAIVAREVQARLEAIASNSAYALLGLLPAGPVLESNVVLAEQASRWLRAAA